MEPIELETRTRFRVTAWHVGELIDVRAFEEGAVLARGPLTVSAGRQGWAMLFRHGVAVLVGLEPVEEASFLRTLAPLVSGRFDRSENEHLLVIIDTAREERLDGTGALSLQEPSLERFQLIAHVLARSVVLAHYEERVSAVFDRIEPLAIRLRTGSRGRIGSRELLKQIGDVLYVQAQTMGRAEVTEKPEITWDRSDLDRLYERLVVEYELRDRDLALGRKLDLIARTATTLLDLLQSRGTLRVEWYIVILIVVEIFLVLYQMFVLHPGPAG